MISEYKIDIIVQVNLKVVMILYQVVKNLDKIS